MRRLAFLRRLLLTAFVAAIAAVGAGATTACTPANQDASVLSPPQVGEPYVETQLFLGTGRHDGAPPITEDEFMEFVRQYVTPRFPSGFTLQEGRGQWRDRQGSINRERSYVLTVLYPRTVAEGKDNDIEFIRDTYKRLYGLESVGRADAGVTADF
ncbi:DUF3574 domain-containing protein [Streptomyces sp. 8N706]|uniref:DUF3574 domain-containing protein n=1 Tax=Streptomyces sp. 8N706 TaxID=3457416 RepID=UPI003FD42AF8